MPVAEPAYGEASEAVAPPTPPHPPVILPGNLAPDGAPIKPAAASRRLLRHRGRAVVFDSIEDFHARVDDPALDIDADSVMVLRGCGPKGYPGMPEVSNMPLPKELLEQGVRDMVRVCDGRMSGPGPVMVRGRAPDNPTVRPPADRMVRRTFRF